MIVGTQNALFKEDKVLIAKRAPLKKLAPNRWNFIGGKVENNELIIEGALREIKEETEISPVKLNFVGEKISSWGDNPAFRCFIFVGFTDQEPQLNIEHTEFKWVSFQEITSYNIIGFDIYEIKEIFEAYLKLK
jgi:8-oxo-dGTP pyrophosphatase MutT (NUDIX family)